LPNMSSIPALVKKKESIAEYIIYMYQTEDLVRSYDLNLDDILEYVIQHMSKNEALIKEQLLWYADIIEQMKNENIINTKLRLKSTQKYVNRLTSLHESRLMNDNSYINVYSKAEKDILEHIALSENTIENSVQICLNGIYGMLLLKLNGKKITSEQQQTLTNFGAVLEHLSEAYKKEYAPLK
jgi:Domain of unknown function (DUF4924)